MAVIKPKNSKSLWLTFLVLILILVVALGWFFYQEMKKINQSAELVNEALVSAKSLTGANKTLNDLKKKVFDELGVLKISGKYGDWPLGQIDLRGHDRGNPFQIKK